MENYEGLTEEQKNRVMKINEEMKIENQKLYNNYATKIFLISLVYPAGAASLLLLAAIIGI